MSDEKFLMVVPSLEELPPFVRSSLEKVAKNEGFIDFNLEIEPGANIGDGFVGIMLKVQIKGTKNSQKSELNVLCKIPPMNKARREQFNSIEIFSREIEMYNIVLPYLKKFQESKGIREDEGFFNYPKCYFAGESKELDDAVVIMEDLRDKGYGMADKFVSIDFPHAKLVMEGLGRLHALSFALKVQEPETLKQWMFKDVLTEMMHRQEFIQMFERYFDQAMEALKPEETDVKEKMEHYKNHIMEEINFLTNAEEAEPYTVLCHVRGFDENNGRVIVKLALGQKPIMLGEKFVQLVTPEEYHKYSKIPVETEHEKKHNGKYGLIASSKNDSKKEEEKERRRSRTPEERYKSSSRYEKPDKYPKESSSRQDKYKSDSRDSSRYDKSSKNGSSRHRYSSESESDSDERHRKSSKSKKKSSSHKHKSHDRDRNRERYYSSDEDRRDRRKSKKEKRGRSRSRSR